jgi:hypothetical protein
MSDEDAFSAESFDARDYNAIALRRESSAVVGSSRISSGGSQATAARNFSG